MSIEGSAGGDDDDETELAEKDIEIELAEAAEMRCGVSLYGPPEDEEGK